MSTKTFTDEETVRQLSTMTLKELTAYRNILLMPAIRSEETRHLNAQHLAIVEKLLKG